MQRGSHAWALTLVEGPSSMTLTAPVWPVPLPLGALLSHSRLTHPVPLGKEDGRSCKKVTIRMTIRKNECRSNTPVRGTHEAVVGTTKDGDGGGFGGWELHSLPHWACTSPGEPSVLRRAVSLCQHLQLQHQHLRPLLQVLPRGGPAAALRAALLRHERHLGALHGAGAHRLCLPVVLRPWELGLGLAGPPLPPPLYDSSWPSVHMWGQGGDTGTCGELVRAEHGTAGRSAESDQNGPHLATLASFLCSRSSTLLPQLRAWGVPLGPWLEVWNGP